MVGVDPSTAFAALGRAHAPHAVHHAPLDALPVPLGWAVAVASLAGLHHLDDLDAGLRAFAIALRPGGRLVVADVERGSGPARFPDGFVDAHNALRHRGAHLGPETAARVTAAGLTVAEDAVVDIP